MKLRKGLQSLLLVLAMALVFSAAAPIVMPNAYTAEAAKKKSTKKSSKKKTAKVNLKINKESVTVKVGKSVKLKVTGNAKKTVKWSISGNCAKLSKKTGTSVSVKGVKDGTVAVTAKVGSSKVSCCVFVGKGTYGDANGKTKKVIGNPIKLLAAYVAKHPITVETGNTGTDKSSWEGRYTNNNIYSLSVANGNLVVGKSYTSVYKNTDGTDSSNYQDSTTMYIPVDGTPEATITYSSSDKWNDEGQTYTSTETYTFKVNINTVTPGTEIQYSASGTRSDGTTWASTEPNKSAFNYASEAIVDVLNCFLVDNKTGFTTKDIGFTAYPATHRGIGVLTTADLAAFAEQMNSLRAYEQAHYVAPTYDDEE